MLASFWSLITLIRQFVDAIALLMGYIKKVQHDNVVKEIGGAVEEVSKPSATEEERRAALKKLEDLVNGRT